MNQELSKTTVRLWFATIIIDHDNVDAENGLIVSCPTSFELVWFYSWVRWVRRIHTHTPIKKYSNNSVRLQVQIGKLQIARSQCKLRVKRRRRRLIHSLTPLASSPRLPLVTYYIRRKRMRCHKIMYTWRTLRIYASKDIRVLDSNIRSKVAVIEECSELSDFAGTKKTC